MRAGFLFVIALALATQAAAFSKPTRPTGAPPQPPSGAEVAARQAEGASGTQALDSGSALIVQSAQDSAPGDFRWKHRALVVFADSVQNTDFILQMRLISARPQPLELRDVIVITDTDPAEPSQWRRELRPKGFSLVIVDKDSRVILRKPRPWDVREISRAIDKLPSRRDELYSPSGK